MNKQVKQIPKLPVWYNEKPELGYGSIRDADGTYLLEDGGIDDNSFLYHKDRNEYIVKCVNNHELLVGALKRAKKVLEAIVAANEAFDDRSSIVTQAERGMDDIDNSLNFK